jgi:hypothetical protein
MMTRVVAISLKPLELLAVIGRLAKIAEMRRR